MAVKVSQECKTNSSWRYFCYSSIACDFCSVACTWGLSEVRGAPNSKPGHLGLLHAGAVGNMEGIACSRIPPRISLPACWALTFSHVWAGKEGDETWTLRVQTERCSVRGLLLAFTSLFYLCRSGKSWNFPFLISSCLWKGSLRSWQRNRLGIHSD